MRVFASTDYTGYGPTKTPAVVIAGDMTEARNALVSALSAKGLISSDFTLQEVGKDCITVVILKNEH